MAKQIKKTIKKSATASKVVAKKAPVKSAPVKENRCNCDNGCPCGCHKHGVAHWLKHVVILAIVFVLGIFAGQALHFGHPRPFPFKHMQPVFTNGCLDMSKIDCPKMQEQMMKMDANGDGCISVEEYDAAKAEFRKNRPERKGPDFPGKKGHGFHQPR